MSDSERERDPTWFWPEPEEVWYAPEPVLREAWVPRWPHLLDKPVGEKTEAKK